MSDEFDMSERIQIQQYQEKLRKCEERLKLAEQKADSARRDLLADDVLLGKYLSKIQSYRERLSEV